jgi:exosortase
VLGGIQRKLQNDIVPGQIRESAQESDGQNEEIMAINGQGSNPVVSFPSTVVLESVSRKLSVFGVAGSLLSFGLLWFILLSQLRVEWTVNPQYSYGWVVPFLCFGLLLRRWQSFTESAERQGENANLLQTADFRVSVIQSCLFATLAFLILPLRLVLEANPNWRTPQWLLACIVISLTLMTVWRSLGAGWARRLAFPICFILIAVAWPPSVETPIIQALTRANVATTIECVGWLGIPATQHANIIEISTGVVGVNEACSGIRSFQSSIMISLFMGEFYRLNLNRRLLLLPVGFILAFVFNLCRTSLLVLVASKHGIAAIDAWHDPAGVTITIASTLTLWGVAILMAAKQKTEEEKQKAKVGNSKPEVSVPRLALPPYKFWLFRSTFNPFRLSVALLLWLIMVQVSVEFWYGTHEKNIRNNPEWKLNWPPKNPSFQERSVPAITWEMLKYDEGHYGTWTSEDNLNWLMYAFKWNPGKIAASSASSHSPDVCLTAAGKTLVHIDDNRCTITIGSVTLPFRRYEFEENGHVVFVFYCLWEEAAPGRSFAQDAVSQLKDVRLKNVLDGRRNLGERSIEIMVSGADNAKSAQTAMARELQKLITLRS